MPLNSQKNKIRLNKFLAHAGVDNRRNCETIIKKGLVKVNKEIITDPNIMVSISDEVLYNDKVLKSEKKVYILINKPKKFVYESEEESQLTLKHLIRSFSEKLNLGYTPELFPVLNMNEMDTGLMLITNDDDVLSTFNKKTSNKNLVYTIQLNKSLSNNDIEDLLDRGNESFLNEIHLLNEEEDNISVGVKVKYNGGFLKLFEDKGYEIEKCDRVIIDDLNKKNLPRGKWRFLKPTEVIKIKHLKY